MPRLGVAGYQTSSKTRERLGKGTSYPNNNHLDAIPIPLHVLEPMAVGSEGYEQIGLLVLAWLSVIEMDPLSLVL